MITITNSQRATVTEIETSIRERDIVCLFGNVPNGKTHLHAYLSGKYSLGLENKDRSSILPSKRNGYTIEVLEGIQITGLSDKIHLNRLKRSILEIYGESFGNNCLNIHRRFVSLLLDLKRAKIMPTIAQDCVELLPKRGYEVYKELNQFSYKGEFIGPAILLSGRFSKRRMPPDYWLHIKEVKVGKVLIEEVEEFTSEVAPGYRYLFTEAALKKLATCPTTAEMRRIIRNAVSYWQRNMRKDEKIDTPIIRLATDELTAVKHRMAA